MHVADRVDVDQGRDERDHQEHDHAQAVDGDSQRDHEVGLEICNAGLLIGGGGGATEKDPVDTARPDQLLMMLRCRRSVLGLGSFGGFALVQIRRDAPPTTPGANTK